MINLSKCYNFYHNPSINTQVIVKTLNQLSEEGDSKARALHASILKWDFIITLVVLQHIFEYTNKLSVYLQVSEQIIIYLCQHLYFKVTFTLSLTRIHDSCVQRAQTSI